MNEIHTKILVILTCSYLNSFIPTFGHWHSGIFEQVKNNPLNYFSLGEVRPLKYIYEATTRWVQRINAEFARNFHRACVSIIGLPSIDCRRISKLYMITDDYKLCMNILITQDPKTILTI